LASARRRSGRSNGSAPFIASIAVSASVKAMSESPWSTSSRLSTDADVVSAVVGESGSSSLSRSASAPPKTW
jgi:hypothetical protein